jgi:hypothetical protein
MLLVSSQIRSDTETLFAFVFSLVSWCLLKNKERSSPTSAVVEKPRRKNLARQHNANLIVI